MPLQLLPHTLLLSAVLACAGAAQAQPASPGGRGALLYNNHCIECHSTQMHWRDKRQARDWASLVGQVQRWQAVAGLQWSEADVAEVARHLNDTIYRFAPAAGNAVSSAAP